MYSDDTFPTVLGAFFEKQEWYFALIYGKVWNMDSSVQTIIEGDSSAPN